MRTFRTLTTAALSLLVAACGDSTYAWREQVLLQEGQQVLVERTARFRENWVAGGGGGSFNKGMTLRVIHGPMPMPQSTWDERFVPIVLERDLGNGEWVVIATFFHCDSWYELGRPSLPYVEFRHREGGWTRQALNPQWIGHPANVLAVDPSEKQAMSGRETLTVERKRTIVETSTMAPEYRRVVDHWSTGC